VFRRASMKMGKNEEEEVGLIKCFRLLKSLFEGRKSTGNSDVK
jgi:hypothetical protein